MLTDVRIYKNRDSATAMLRKLGIAAVSYPKFFEKQEDGSYKVFVLKAEQSLLSAAVPVVAAAEIANPKQDTFADLEGREAIDERHATRRRQRIQAARDGAVHRPLPDTVSVGAVIREMVRAGHTNAEIWAVVQPKFNIPDSRKWYVSWYKSDMKRNNK